MGYFYVVEFYFNDWFFWSFFYLCVNLSELIFDGKVDEVSGVKVFIEFGCFFFNVWENLM